MACNTITTIIKGCDNSVGGILGAWVFDMSDITLITPDTTNWTYTALTITPSIPVAFEFKRNTSNYTEEIANDLVAGSTFYTQTINLVFSRREATKSRSLNILAEGQRDLGILIKDANGQYILFTDAQLNANTEGSGTAKADNSKYNVTFVAESLTLAKYIDEADALAFISTGTI